MMKTFRNAQTAIRVIGCCLFIFVVSCKQASMLHQENGWYLITDGQKDSLASRPIVTVKDFAAIELVSDDYGLRAISGSVNKQKQKVWADAGAPDKPCGVGRADANPKLLLNDT